jgi:hypothetical protein
MIADVEAAGISSRFVLNTLIENKYFALSRDARSILSTDIGIVSEKSQAPKRRRTRAALVNLA